MSPIEWIFENPWFFGGMTWGFILVSWLATWDAVRANRRRNAKALAEMETITKDGLAQLKQLGVEQLEDLERRRDTFIAIGRQIERMAMEQAGTATEDNRVVILPTGRNLRPN